MKRVTIRLEDEQLMQIMPLLFQPSEAPPVQVLPPAPGQGLLDAPYKRRSQKRTEDGRDSRQVVIDKVRSFGGKWFHLAQVESIGQLTGFAPATLRSRLAQMAQRGELEKEGRYHFRVTAKAAWAHRDNLPYENSSEASSSEDAA